MTFDTYKHRVYTPNKLNKRLQKTGLLLLNLDKKLKNHIELNRLVVPIVAEHASVEVMVTRYEKGVLDLAVDNHSTANHLHYLSYVLIEELKTHYELSDLTDITTFVKPAVFVRCTTYAEERKNCYTVPIAQETSTSIALLAKETVKHKGVQDALLELASSLSKKANKQ